MTDQGRDASWEHARGGTREYGPEDPHRREDPTRPTAPPVASIQGVPQMLPARHMLPSAPPSFAIQPHPQTARQWHVPPMPSHAAVHGPAPAADASYRGAYMFEQAPFPYADDAQLHHGAGAPHQRGSMLYPRGSNFYFQGPSHQRYVSHLPHGHPQHFPQDAYPPTQAQPLPQHQMMPQAQALGHHREQLMHPPSDPSTSFRFAADPHDPNRAAAQLASQGEAPDKADNAHLAKVEGNFDVEDGTGPGKEAGDLAGTPYHSIAAAAQPADSFGDAKAQETTKGAWSDKEDTFILQMIEKHGTPKGCWKTIAQKMQNRTGKQVRERYRNQLDPKLTRGPWRAEEDRILFETQELIGNKWTEIAKLLDGRSDNMVKNRFHSKARRQWEQQRALMGRGTADMSAHQQRQRIQERPVGHVVKRLAKRIERRRAVAMVVTVAALTSESMRTKAEAGGAATALPHSFAESATVDAALGRTAHAHSATSAAADVAAVSAPRGVSELVTPSPRDPHGPAPFFPAKPAPVAAPHPPGEAQIFASLLEEARRMQMVGNEAVRKLTKAGLDALRRIEPQLEELRDAIDLEFRSTSAEPEVFTPSAVDRALRVISDDRPALEGLSLKKGGSDDDEESAGDEGDAPSPGGDADEGVTREGYQSVGGGADAGKDVEDSDKRNERDEDDGNDDEADAEDDAEDDEDDNDDDDNDDDDNNDDDNNDDDDDDDDDDEEGKDDGDGEEEGMGDSDSVNRFSAAKGEEEGGRPCTKGAAAKPTIAHAVSRESGTSHDGQASPGGPAARKRPAPSEHTDRVYRRKLARTGDAPAGEDSASLAAAAVRCTRRLISGHSGSSGSWIESSDGSEGEETPITLLPHFKFLNEMAQASLMKRLIDIMSSEKAA